MSSAATERKEERKGGRIPHYLMATGCVNGEAAATCEEGKEGRKEDGGEEKSGFSACEIEWT